MAVQINWSQFVVLPKDNLKSIKNKITKKELSVLNDKRGIYVIKLNAPFALDYPKGPSDILYIGSGSPWARFSQHRRNWLKHMGSKFNFTFTFMFAMPRVQNNFSAFKGIEGDLHAAFYKKFGSYPWGCTNKKIAADYKYKEDAGNIFSLDIDETFHASLRFFGAQAI